MSLELTTQILQKSSTSHLFIFPLFPLLIYNKKASEKISRGLDYKRKEELKILVFTLVWLDTISTFNAKRIIHIHRTPYSKDSWKHYSIL